MQWGEWEFALPLFTQLCYTRNFDTSRMQWGEWKFALPLFTQLCYTRNSETSRMQWGEWEFALPLFTQLCHTRNFGTSKAKKLIPLIQYRKPENESCTAVQYPFRTLESEMQATSIYLTPYPHPRRY